MLQQVAKHAHMCDEKKTTKYYEARNHPPFDAAGCVGEVKTGNDGKRYVALPSQSSKGKYRWYRNVGSAKQRAARLSLSSSAGRRRPATKQRKSSSASKKRGSRIMSGSRRSSGSRSSSAVKKSRRSSRAKTLGSSHQVAVELAAALGNREPVTDPFLQRVIARAEEELKIARDYNLLRTLDLSYNRGMDILLRAVALERRFANL